MKKRIPCRKCAMTPRPLFINCELEKLEHGLTTYDNIRPMLLTVLEHDIPHEDCRAELIRQCDETFGGK